MEAWCGDWMTRDKALREVEHTSEDRFDHDCAKVLVCVRFFTSEKAFEFSLFINVNQKS